jgi:hypothetical protein
VNKSPALSLPAGVLEAVSAAVSIKPPVYCYPVSELALESPVGWTHGKGSLDPDSTKVDFGSVSVASSSCAPRLRDCLLLQPGSTVGDLYDALKRGALPHVTLQGDFVRAEGTGLGSMQHDDSSSGVSAPKKRQLGRDAIIDSTCCIIRIQTNRKAVWQQASATVALPVGTS